LNTTNNASFTLFFRDAAAAAWTRITQQQPPTDLGERYSPIPFP
jgi:hypothetical protein